MKNRRAIRKKPRRQIPSVADEAASAVRGEIKRALSVAGQQSTLLHSIAVQVTALTDDVLVDSTAEQLSQRAHELRGVVIHGLCVLNELQHVNGRLESLAAIRRSFPPSDDD